MLRYREFSAAAAAANASIPARMHGERCERERGGLIVSMVNAIELVVWIGLACVAIRPTARWPPSSRDAPGDPQQDAGAGRGGAPVGGQRAVAAQQVPEGRPAAAARHKNPAIAIEV